MNNVYKISHCLSWHGYYSHTAHLVCQRGLIAVENAGVIKHDFVSCQSQYTVPQSRNDFPVCERNGLEQRIEKGRHKISNWSNCTKQCLNRVTITTPPPSLCNTLLPLHPDAPVWGKSKYSRCSLVLWMLHMSDCGNGFSVSWWARVRLAQTHPDPAIKKKIKKKHNMFRCIPKSHTCALFYSIFLWLVCSHWKFQVLFKHKMMHLLNRKKKVWNVGHSMLVALLMKWNGGGAMRCWIRKKFKMVAMTRHPTNVF